MRRMARDARGRQMVEEVVFDREGRRIGGREVTDEIEGLGRREGGRITDVTDEEEGRGEGAVLGEVETGSSGEGRK